MFCQQHSFLLRWPRWMPKSLHDMRRCYTPPWNVDTQDLLIKAHEFKNGIEFWSALLPVNLEYCCDDCIWCQVQIAIGPIFPLFQVELQLLEDARDACCVGKCSGSWWCAIQHLEGQIRQVSVHLVLSSSAFPFMEGCVQVCQWSETTQSNAACLVQSLIALKTDA